MWFKYREIYTSKEVISIGFVTLKVQLCFSIAIFNFLEYIFVFILIELCSFKTWSFRIVRIKWSVFFCNFLDFFLHYIICFRFITLSDSGIPRKENKVVLLDHFYTLYKNLTVACVPLGYFFKDCGKSLCDYFKVSLLFPLFDSYSKIRTWQ